MHDIGLNTDVPVIALIFFHISLTGVDCVMVKVLFSQLDHLAASIVLREAAQSRLKVM